MKTKNVLYKRKFGFEMSNYKFLVSSDLYKQLLRFHTMWTPVITHENLVMIKELLNRKGLEQGSLDEFIEHTQNMSSPEQGLFIESESFKLNVFCFYDLLKSVGGAEMAVRELRDVKHSLLVVLDEDNIESFKQLACFLDEYTGLFQDVLSVDSNHVN